MRCSGAKRPIRSAETVAAVRIIQRPDRDRLGEGLWWSVGEQALYWVDIHGARLNRLQIDTDAVTTWAMPAKIGWAIERSGHSGFMVGLADGVAALTLDPFQLSPLALPLGLGPADRLNDACADAEGRLWFGTMADDAQAFSGGLYRLGADFTLTRMDAPYCIPNGPVFSHDGRTLYHTDSRLRTVFRFAVAGDGGLGARTAHIVFPESWGAPDGMAVDADDHLWICQYGGGRISRFDPGGRLDRSCALPTARITNAVFAGAGLDRMFVTSAADPAGLDPLAGALFEIEPGARGMPPHRFAG